MLNYRLQLHVIAVDLLLSQHACYCIGWEAVAAALLISTHECAAGMAALCCNVVLLALHEHRNVNGAINGKQSFLTSRMLLARLRK
jgi:hypothetical protein